MNQEANVLREEKEISLPNYETPKIQVLTEPELLSAIQINAGATSWRLM